MSVKRLILLSLVFAISAAAQTDDSPQRAAVRTPTGAHFIWNQPGNNFTLEINGQDVRPNNTSRDVYFNADGITIQIQTAAIEQFVRSAPRPDEQTILVLHRDWEVEHAEAILGKLTLTQSTEVRLADGRRTLFWRFNLPDKFSDQGKETLFLTSVNGNYIIVLAANVKTMPEADHVRQFLTDTMSTLKVSDKPFELPRRQ